MALARSHCPRAVRLFQDPALLAQPGDRAVMDARARILLRAPDAADVIDAYFASPVLDMSIQEKITCRIASREHALLLPMMSQRERACNMSHGGDYNWFNTLPISNTHSISNDDYGFALSDRLLVLLTPTHESSICRHCNKPVGTHGYHCVLCTADCNPDRTALSDALRDECARMHRVANHHGVRIEPCTNEVTQHRGDVSSDSYVTGNRVALDIATIAPYCESVVDLAAHPPGIAAKTAEDAKDAKHGPAVRAQGGTFVPLAWEVGGHWGDKAVAFFKLIARQATSAISEAAAFEAYWLRRLSIVGRT